MAIKIVKGNKLAEMTGSKAATKEAIAFSKTDGKIKTSKEKKVRKLGSAITITEAKASKDLVGKYVAAKQNTGYYPARLMGVKGDKAIVRFDGGSPSYGEVSLSEVRVFKADCPRLKKREENHGGSKLSETAINSWVAWYDKKESPKAESKPKAK